MEKNTSSSRFSALDGLRGFAIILVFLNHINTSYISQLLPTYLFNWIFYDGVTGVSILFILSGFLMSYIYPNPQNKINFLQKRYTRIFPLFLTMCMVMIVAKNVQSTLYGSIIIIIIGLSLITHFLWVYVVKRVPTVFSRLLFFIFILLQVGVGLFYMLWIMRRPPNVFLTEFPLFAREAIIGLVNMTLTLPLGDYIPMIDGVYWSLVAEVLFYILYPFVLIPIISLLMQQSRKIKVLFFIFLIPLFGGIHTLSEDIMVLNLIQFALFFYFTTGIILGHLYKNHREILIKKISFFNNKKILLILLSFFVMASVHYLVSTVPREIVVWIRILYAIPLTILVAFTLEKGNILYKIFTNKILLLIGTLSYSIYLSHSVIILVSKNYFIPNSFATNLLVIIGTFLGIVFISYILFQLLEKPYFLKRIELVQTKPSENIKTYSSKLILLSIIGIYIIGILSAYQSQFNFFSYKQPLFITLRNFDANTKTLLLTNNSPMRIDFTAQKDNLGVISLQLSHDQIRLNNIQSQSVHFSIKEKGSTIIHSSATYTLDYFNNSEEFPFGFPPLMNSKNKEYSLEFILTNKESSDYLTIQSDTFFGIYQANKKDILTHIPTLFEFLTDKSTTILTHRHAQFVGLLGAPFMILSLYLIVKKTHA